MKNKYNLNLIKAEPWHDDRDYEAEGTLSEGVAYSVTLDIDEVELYVWDNSDGWHSKSNGIKSQAHAIHWATSEIDKYFASLKLPPKKSKRRNDPRKVSLVNWKVRMRQIFNRPMAKPEMFNEITYSSTSGFNMLSKLVDHFK